MQQRGGDKQIKRKSAHKMQQVKKYRKATMPQANLKSENIKWKY